MRHLATILGVLAMLVSLTGPLAALAAMAPCEDASMAMMDDMAPCTSAAKACAVTCPAAGNCQSPCGSTLPGLSADVDGLASPLFMNKLRMALSVAPPGADSPVDGPPPRI